METQYQTSKCAAKILHRKKVIGLNTRIKKEQLVAVM